MDMLRHRMSLNNEASTHNETAFESQKTMRGKIKNPLLRKESN